MANYIKPKEFLEEILISKKQDKLTKKATEMMILLAERAIKKKTYTNQMDREDCLQTALLVMFQNWRNFNENVSENAFAYFTEIFKRGIARGLKDIQGGSHPSKKGDPEGKIMIISLDSCNDGDGIYNI